MSYIDLRYIVLLAINTLKSQAASPWDWDPYQALGQPTVGFCFSLAHEEAHQIRPKSLVFC